MLPAWFHTNVGLKVKSTARFRKMHHSKTKQTARFNSSSKMRRTFRLPGKSWRFASSFPGFYFIGKGVLVRSIGNRINRGSNERDLTLPVTIYKFLFFWARTNSCSIDFFTNVWTFVSILVTQRPRTWKLWEKPIVKLSYFILRREEANN